MKENESLKENYESIKKQIEDREQLMKSNIDEGAFDTKKFEGLIKKSYNEKMKMIEQKSKDLRDEALKVESRERELAKELKLYKEKYSEFSGTMEKSGLQKKIYEQEVAKKEEELKKKLEQV